MVTNPSQKKIEDIWQLLEEIKDPEIPVVSLVEMGMIRQVGLDDSKVIIILSPTFAGCPALDVMQAEINRRLRQSGALAVEVRLSLKPPWTTDWITPQGREKLKSFGLAPPPLHAGRLEQALQQPVACPYCDSTRTEVKNDFGPTLCRAIWYCYNCQQPFEQFKPI